MQQRLLDQHKRVLPTYVHLLTSPIQTKQLLEVLREPQAKALLYFVIKDMSEQVQQHVKPMEHLVLNQHVLPVHWANTTMIYVNFSGTAAVGPTNCESVKMIAVLDLT